MILAKAEEAGQNPRAWLPASGRGQIRARGGATSTQLRGGVVTPVGVGVCMWVGSVGGATYWGSGVRAGT